MKKIIKEHQDNAPVKKNENRIVDINVHEMYSLLERGVSDSVIKAVTLSEVMDLIVNNENVKKITGNFRRLIDSGKIEDAKLCKLNQSCIAVSAILEGGTGAENCVGFNQKVLSDYDHLTLEEVERCRAILQNDEHCLFFYQSMGGHGHGFHIVTPVMGVHDEKSHKIAWQQVNQYYDKLLGLKHDTTCSDLARKSILAHDPQAFCNPQAKPFYIDYTPLVSNRKPGRPLKGVHHTIEEIGQALHQYMTARNLTYTEGNRNCYVFNAACQLNRYGVKIDEALDYFYEKAHDLSENEIRQAVHSAYDRNTEQHGTMSPYNGHTEKQEKKTIGVQDIQDYLKTLGEFRYNLISQRYEIRWIDIAEWTDITDSILNDIWVSIWRDLSKLKKHEVQSIIESNFSVPYNPLVESLKALDSWDGVTDHIGNFANMIHVRPGHESYFALKDAFMKWIVGVVASICDPQAFNKKIFTLIGKQNTFKTSILRSLALPSWGPGAVYTKNSFREFNRDEHLIMTQSPIIIMDEVSHLCNGFLDELKSVTSQTTINERRPYGHYKESLPRISSFCATGNYTNFLTDTTGNNRFLVYEVESIDSPFETPINVEGLWSQAYQLYLNGYPYWFNREEDMLIDKQNVQYEVVSAEEDLIRTYYMIPQPGEQYKLVNATNIIEYVSVRYKHTLNQRKINQVMRKLGFKEKRSSDARGLFMVQEIPLADIDMRQKSSDWSHLPTTDTASETTSNPTFF